MLSSYISSYIYIFSDYALLACQSAGFRRCRFIFLQHRFIAVLASKLYIYVRLKYAGLLSAASGAIRSRFYYICTLSLHLFRIVPSIVCIVPQTRTIRSHIYIHSYIYIVRYGIIVGWVWDCPTTTHSQIPSAHRWASISISLMERKAVVLSSECVHGHWSPIANSDTLRQTKRATRIRNAHTNTQTHTQYVGVPLVLCLQRFLYIFRPLIYPPYLSRTRGVDELRS